MPKRIHNPEGITREDLLLRQKAALKLKARELAEDFALFFPEALNVIEPGTEFVPSPHYDLICEWLHYAASGRMRQEHPEWIGMIFNVPPRSLKSLQVNVSFPAHTWTYAPEKKFLCISYGQDLATPLSIKRRDLIQSPWYNQLWPKVRIKEDANLKTRYDNNRAGYMIAGTPGGATTGLGGNIIIIDDLLKADEAYSDAARISANEFYDNTLKSRLNNPADDFFVVVCQRLHQEDIVGHLLESEPGRWQQIVIPLECEEDTDYVFPISGKVWHRKKGDILLAERFTPVVVDNYKLNSRMFAGQYQQKPMPATGNLIDPKWWQYYDAEHLPSLDTVLISADCSFKGTQRSDYVCLQKWGFAGSRAYLLDLLNTKLDFVGTEAAILSMLARGEKTSVLLIEEAANGAAIISSLKRRANLPCTIVPVAPEGGKLSRAMAAQPEVEVGNCFLPREAPWLQDFINQLALGPAAAKNDDMIDAWSQAIEYRRAHRWGFFESLEQRVKGTAESTTQAPKKPPTPSETVKDRQADARRMVRSEFAKRLGRRF